MLAGVAIAIASFSNLALLPAGLVALLILWFAYPRRSIALTILACFLTWLILGYLYFDLLGVGHQLIIEHARSTQGLVGTLWQQLKKIITNLMVLVMGILLSWVGWYFVVNRVAIGTKSYLKRYFVLSMIVTLGFFWLLQAMIHIAESQYDTLAVYFYSVLWIPFTWLVFWRVHCRRDRWVMTSSMLVVLTFIFNHGGTTQNPYFAVFALYLPLLISLVLIWFFDQYHHIHYLLKWLMVGLICLMYVYPLFIQDGTILAKSPLWQNQFTGPYGADMNHHEIKLIDQAQQLYRQYYCKQKWFFAFYDEPKWYVIFKRHAPFDQSWVSRVHFYPRNKAITVANILSVLKHQNSWRVIYGADHGWYAKGIAVKDLQPVVAYLQSHSTQQIRLGRDVSDNQTVLYFLVKE